MGRSKNSAGPNTPKVSMASSSKRMLTSPDDAIDLKKNRMKSPTTSDTPVMNSEPDTCTLIPTQQVCLSEKDLKFISSQLSTSFQEQLQTMVQSVVSAIVPDLVAKLNDQLLEKINSLEGENEDLRCRISALELEQDRANQYSRRNNLRITGVPESGDENTDDIILDIAQSIGANLSINEIDRSHRIGKASDKVDWRGRPIPREIIVKLTSYRSRQKLYSKRHQLKSGSYSNCFINEDLTLRRSSLLYKARQLKRCGDIVDSWSSDGNILVKTSNNKVHVISSETNLNKFQRQRLFAEVVQSGSP
ncbi:hypothetical protein ACF0H5_018923 [Mactra antiquata]